MMTSEPAPDGGGRLWPTPNATDHIVKRTMHAGGNLTLQGAVSGVNPVDAERLSRPATEPDDQQLTLWPEDSHANPSARPGKGSRRRIAGGSGPQPVTSFATYDPGGCCWKTYQDCLDGASVTWSETWPRSGMTRNGIAYRRASSVPPIYATASGLWPTPVHKPGGGSTLDGGSNSRKAAKARQMWPTPTSGDAKASGSRNLPGSNAHPGVSLTDAVTRGNSTTPRLWPTPKGNAANYGRPRDNDRGDLQAAVTRLPTPTANRWSGLQSHGQNALLGQLNPRWVEWLMGYPDGWTDCED